MPRRKQTGLEAHRLTKLRVKHHAGWVRTAAICAVVVTIAPILWTSFQRSGLSYLLWKQGLNPLVGQGVERGILSDPKVEQIFIGKTAAELTSMLDDVHPTQGSFDILVSKQLGPRKAGQEWFQWGDRYFVFELTDGRVTAVKHVSG